jgi:CDP-paratose 2-epimerase
VVAFDNLYRRGSQLNLPRLEAAGVRFIRGDVREPSELSAVESIDALVECSAEPSALAGLEGDTAYPIHTNLTGAYNCLELARRDGAQLVFLSTSRVYPFPALNAIAFEEKPTRFELQPEQSIPGVSPAGISERFPIAGARTLYGATKLAAELLVTEYAAGFGLQTVIDRCGVIAGPWQMGKVDQGVFTFWMLHHYFRRPLRYIGYGGEGKQVRDLLHVEDLVELIDEQLLAPDRWAGVTANVGGGPECSLSLLETTRICRELTANQVPIEPLLKPRYGDVPIYISDCEMLFRHTSWRPRMTARRVLGDILDWITANADQVGEALGVRAPAKGRV